MTALLVPGLTCSELLAAPRSGLLVDGRDFYRAVYDACCSAERSIVMLGWQFEGKVELVRGDDGEREHAVGLVAMLRELCEQRPELEVHILAWDASAIFAFEREPLQRLMFSIRGHRRIHYRMDNRHPVGASHHQKLIVVDRSIAFLGGMDVCGGRWDDRSHAAVDPLRCSRDQLYGPYHDVQAYVTGPAVDVLRGWFAERWHVATGHELPAVDPPCKPIAIQPTRELDAPCIGLARTWPRMESLNLPAIHELAELHLRAISLAERIIYIENQYLTSRAIADALEQRMQRGQPALEIVVVLPQRSGGFKERISIGIYQERILARLGEVAAATGNHVGVYYSAAPGPEGDVPVFIHAKVLAVDDRFLLVSSANTTNRSMGFDSELGIAWESPTTSPSLQAARVDLLAEHCGVDAGVLGSIDGLVARLDELARARTHRLRMHGRNRDERPGRLLAWLLPDGETPLDPDDPEDTLPEPGAVLDRLFRDPFTVVRTGVRGLRRRFAASRK